MAFTAPIPTVDPAGHYRPTWSNTYAAQHPTITSPTTITASTHMPFPAFRFASESEERTDDVLDVR